MRVWAEPPKGPRGRQDKGHAREVQTAQEVDALRELERRGFTFRVDHPMFGRRSARVADIAHWVLDK